MIDVLRIIVERLEKHNVKWLLAGSSSLALQDVKIEPNDIDILTNAEDALKLNNIFKEFMVRKVSFSRSDIFESYFGEFNILGVKVEVMGDLREKISGEWTSLKDRLENVEFVELDFFKVPVPPLDEQLAAYQKLNREKDIEKIKLIQEQIKKANK